MGIEIMIPTILGLVAALTSMGLSKRFAPLAAVVFGIGLAFLANHAVNAGLSILGIIAGLSASGLYSGVKTTANIGGTPNPASTQV